jgi:hypothetical protein
MTPLIPVRGKVERCLDLHTCGELGNRLPLASPHGSINTGAGGAWEPFGSS